MLSRALLLASALHLATMGYASAKDFSEPLSEWIQKHREEREPSYLFTRCAGMYLALSGYVGRERAGDAAWAAYRKGVELLTLKATAIRMSNGTADAAAQSKGVQRDVLRIDKLYTARLNANYAASGSAFGEDHLIRSDMALCKRVVEKLGRSGQAD